MSFLAHGSNIRHAQGVGHTTIPKENVTIAR